MKKIAIFFIIFTLKLFGNGENMQGQESFILNNYKFDLSMYPKAKNGYKQHIIALKEQDDEDKFRIEIEFGRNLEVDCNIYFLINSKLEEHNVDGWGYNYYEFSGDEVMAGTRMMCYDDKSVKFISYNSNLTPRYNSKLPIIIYTQNGISFRVKIYKEVENKEFK